MKKELSARIVAVLTLATLIVLVGVGVAQPASAQLIFSGEQSNTSGVQLLNPLCTSGSSNCQNSTVEGLLKTIVNWLFVIATPIAVGMILIGAFQMLFSGGNEDKFAIGKRTVLYAVIGYAIILIGWGITSIIQSLLSQ
ncbi:pilin [Patescibacteria group bacterium]|nr:pilin [Patescibacteria group bacterium]